MQEGGNMPQRVSPMLEQIRSLPQLVEESLTAFAEAAEEVLVPRLCSSITRFYLTGCGDSFHAALGAELAFHTLAGVPTQALSSLPFARYTAPFLSDPEKATVIGISVSGEVARTIEALRLARKAGAGTFAVTGTPGSRLAQAVEFVLKAKIAPPASAVPTPGVRSYVASLLMLYLAAIRVGEVRGFLTSAAAASARDELIASPQAIAATVESNQSATEQLAARWRDADEFVFLGAGPNYGTALFCAAKLLEASGDPALGQDTEEWTHLQYFERAVTTPTFVIDASGRGSSRSREAAVAARTIGRRVAAVVPSGESEIASQAEAVLPVLGEVREAFSPLVYGLPGMLFADFRTQVLGEQYFRAFGGSRSAEGGGGISRIRTSVIQEELQP
jgi:glucosamine--fructose-6-phosphate aminotransferase (isomerizing)